MTIANHSYKRGRATAPPPRLAPAAQPGLSIRVHHPLAAHLVLRTSADWHTDLPPVARTDGAMAEFRLPSGRHAGPANPACVSVRSLLWASGFDVPLTGALGGAGHPSAFEPPAHGTITDRSARALRPGGRPARIRAYLPPDYDAHPDCRYPAIYMQDGQTSSCRRNLRRPDLEGGRDNGPADRPRPDRPGHCRRHLPGASAWKNTPGPATRNMGIRWWTN